MVNRPKKIGTAGESAVVKLLRTRYNFPDNRASRMTLSGRYDIGDIHAEFPDGSTYAIEVKAGKQADDASLADIIAWEAETILEAAAANTGRMMLVVKRRGYAPERVESWRAFIPLESPAHDRDVWVEMPVREAMEWLGDIHGRYSAVPSGTLVA